MSQHGMYLTLDDYKWEAQCHRFGLFGEMRVLMGSEQTPLFFCQSHEKREMEIVRVVRKKIERGCERKLIRKSRVEAVEGMFTHIIKRGI